MSVETYVPNEVIESLVPHKAEEKHPTIKLNDNLESLDDGTKEMFLLRARSFVGVKSEQEYNFHIKRHDYLEEKPFEALTPEEKDNYIKNMAYLVPKSMNKEGGYYYFGPSKFNKHGSKESKAAWLLTAINDPEFDKKLTQEELELMVEVERDTFKVHLDIPKEMKIQVLKKLLETEKQDNLISSRWFSEKEQQGEDIVDLEFSLEERKKEGIKLSSVIRYKMSEIDFENDQFPDFVFYVNPRYGQTPKEALKATVHELRSVLSDLDIPDSESVPRFSSKVEIDGEVVPGMSFVQGNGDLKNYILNQENGADVLREIYPEKNFSAMEKIEF